MKKLAFALTLAVLVSTISSGARIAAQQPADQLATGIAPEALAQIDALIREKASRTAVQQKIDSQLLYQLKMESGQSIADGVSVLETDLQYAGDGHAVVDIAATPGSNLVPRLSALGLDVESMAADGSSLRAHVNVADLETIAAEPAVIFIQPRQGAVISRVIGPESRPFPRRAAALRAFLGGAMGQEALPNVATPTGQGSRSSEGDVTHLAFAARGAFHIDGSGVKIGVLSDGVRNLAASQAAGDLGPVTVIGPASPCPVANTCDEGTAMLEIVHDLAPGAQLYFASAFVSLTSFADNIRALRAAGCDIIVDDVFYFVETPFQDGQLAPTNTNGGAVIQAVKDVTASGALYFSSAGNSGNLDAGTAGAWEGDFVDGGATAAPLPAAGRLHNFGGQNFNLLTVANTGGAPISLYWSDPLGGSSNDYDLFRLNAAGTAIATASTNIQNGTQDPIEQISQSLTNPRIVIVKKDTAQPRFLHLNTNRGQLSIRTSGTTHGHATVTGAGAYGVAATPAVGPFPQAFSSANSVETFSSDGPRHIFYQANGTPITRPTSSTGGQVLQKRHHRRRRRLGDRRRRIPEPVLRHVGSGAARGRHRGIDQVRESRVDAGADPNNLDWHRDRHRGAGSRPRFRRGHHHGQHRLRGDRRARHGVSGARDDRRVGQSRQRQRPPGGGRGRAPDAHAQELRRGAGDQHRVDADDVDVRHHHHAAERADLSQPRRLGVRGEFAGRVLHGRG
jgi:hypothetical protein